ncbi:PAS domain S-box protein [Longimicrobium sp.]|jgi:PAS domain S-box-containing protein|uniref:PAS domain S-box protein n=1 Tax=Longimicrobium sp. TaxID=2029185 RepID=UPI002F92C447
MPDRHLKPLKSESLLPRFTQLRTEAGAPRPRKTLLVESLGELECAIEELRVTEEELRQHQGLLAEAWQAAESTSEWNRDLFEGAAECMLATDPDGLIRDVNRAAGVLFGVRPEHLRGKPLAVFVPDDQRREFRIRLERAGNTGEPMEWEMEIAARGQAPRWVEARVAPFAPRTAAGGLHWTLRDVTSRRAADQSRAEAVETLRLALNASDRAAVLLDVDGTVMLWTPAAESLLGWMEAEVAGARVPAFDEFAERVIDRVAAQKTEGTRVPVRARTKDGAELDLEVKVSPLAGAAGTARGTVLHLAPAGAADEEIVPAAAAAAPEAQAAQLVPGQRSAWSEAEARRVLLSVPQGGDLVEALRQGIAAGVYLGHLRPGDRLPSIREVTRHTGHDHRYVSAAYRRLATEGVVEIRTRHGVVVGSGPQPAEAPENETAAWLAGVIGQAAEVQVKVPHLPDLVRKWTAAAAVRCLCVDGTEDGLASLTAELGGQWGFETRRLNAADGPRRDDLLTALREADLVVTTPFHVASVESAARAAGVPVVVLEASHEIVAAAEDRLREGPLTAVVVDPRYGERLKCMAGGERLNVVLADDTAAVEALDAAEPVLLTRAAQQKVKRSMRLLAPVSPSFSSSRAGDLAAVLIRRNLSALRNGG